MNRMMDYPLMEPPFEAKAFSAMSRAEARRHFEWFVSQSEPRRAILLRAVRATGGPQEELDYSPGSLEPLWAWGGRFVETTPLSEREIQAFRQSAPAWALQAGIGPTKELTVGTKCLAVDIGFYLAEVFLNEWDGLGWALWTRKTFEYHMPILSGFRLPLVPHVVVSNCAWDVINTGAHVPDLLLKTYRVWEGKICLA